MAKSNFSVGDSVVHKTTDQFEMIIIDNCMFGQPTQEQMANQSKDPNRFLCKYYNDNTDKWEEVCFYGFELSPSEE